MEFLLQLFIILFLARLCGEAAHRLGQPSSLGEIVAGILTALAAVHLAPQLPVLVDLRHSPVITHSADAGIFTLILLAGLEMEPNRIIRRSARSIVIALGGAILPLSLGLTVAWWFLPAGPDLPAQALLCGVALSITAIPVSIRVIEELGIMESECARTILAAAVVDDVLGLVLMAVMVAVLGSGEAIGWIGFGLIFAKVAAFFAISIVLGHHVYPHLRRGIELAQALSVELSALILAAMAFSLLAELLGLNWILGPFMAGLFFEPAQVGERVFEEVRLTVSAIANGVLGPLFFFTIGLSLELSAIADAPAFLGALVAVAFLGKIVGAGLPARLMGLTSGESAVIGVGMCARGAVELVILSIALESGIALTGPGDGSSGTLFSALVMTAVLTTLATPVLLRALVRRVSI